MGIGGSSGGGGSSGEVKYPDYLQDIHNEWLNHADTDYIEVSMVDTMNAALGASPFIAATAYNPTTTLATAEVPITAVGALSLTTLVSDALASIADITTAVDAIVTDSGLGSRIATDVSTYSDILDNEVDTKILPKFQRGMQDINAVMSSSFVIGEALIEAEKLRQVAKFTADLELRAFSERNNIIVSLGDFTLKSLSARLDFYKTVAQLSVEFARIKIVAMKEYTDAGIELDEKDATWDLRVFQHGANLMAAISGAAATTNSKSGMGSVLGGVFSGASAGAMVGNAVPGLGTAAGAGIGAILGGIAGIF